MQIEGDRSPGPHLLADGAYAGHLSRVSSTTPFPLSGKYLYRASFHLTAAWLAQLVGCQSAVREVEGSSPGPDQHSGS